MIKVDEAVKAACHTWKQLWIDLETQGNRNANKQPYTVPQDWAGFSELQRTHVLRGIQSHADKLVPTIGTYYQISSSDKGIICTPDLQRNRNKEFQDRCHADSVACDDIVKRRKADYPDFYKNASKLCAFRECSKTSATKVVLTRAEDLVGEIQRMVKPNDIERAVTGDRWCYSHKNTAPVDAHPMAYRSNSDTRACECCFMAKASGMFCRVCERQNDSNADSKKGELLFAQYMVPVCAKYKGSVLPVDFGENMNPDGTWRLTVGDRNVTVVAEQDGSNHGDAVNVRDAIKPALAMDAFLCNKNDILIVVRHNTQRDTIRNISVSRSWILWVCHHIYFSPDAMPRFVYLLVDIPSNYFSNHFPASTIIAVRNFAMPTTLTAQKAHAMHEANIELKKLVSEVVTAEREEIKTQIKRDVGSLWEEVHWQACLAPLSMGRTYLNEFASRAGQYTSPVCREIAFMFPMCDIGGIDAKDRAEPRLPDVHNCVSGAVLRKTMETYADKYPKDGKLAAMVGAVTKILEKDSKKDETMKFF